MRTNLPWLAAALLWSVPASAESRPARIHIDVFGSRRVSAEDAERVLGTRLQAFRALRLRKDESAARMAAKEKTALEKRLLGMGDFAWAEIESL
ncbi:MAG TPA: hypothetical protein VNI01_06665, partial [Elusimicrobiota bacterium]|nr:hypothetical protein [Elusimicrobiota bacterium]